MGGQGGTDKSQWLTPPQQQGSTENPQPDSSATKPDSIDILWNSGPFIGKARYQASDEYIWALDVNVVSVQLSFDVTETSIVIADQMTNPPLQNTVRKGLVDSISRTLDPANTTMFGPATEVTVKVQQITGPVRHGAARGLDHLELGFIQNISLAEHRAIYGNTNQLPVSSKYRGQSYLDTITFVDTAGDWNNPQGKTFEFRSSPPWYHSKDIIKNDAIVGPAAVWRPNLSDQNGSKTLRTEDSPRAPMAPPNAQGNPFIHPNGERPLTRVEIEWNFNVWYAVRTRDGIDEENQPTVPTNDAYKAYFSKANATWAFNGSGNVANGDWTANGAAVTSPNNGQFTQSEPRFNVAEHGETEGDVFNDLLDNFWPLLQ